MNDAVTFSCCIGTTNPLANLGIEVWVNDIQVFDLDHVTKTIKFSHPFDDVNGHHSLKFVMKNKTHDHTELNESGTIINDACLTIQDITFEKINLDQLFSEKSVYKHSYNDPTQTIKLDKFYGTMGCNGTVTFEFDTPIYLWLLEHM